jgi:hypothetical protein
LEIVKGRNPYPLYIRLRRFIRRNGSPVSGGFFVHFAAREPRGERQNAVIPSKNSFFDGLNPPEHRRIFCAVYPQNHHAENYLNKFDEIP